MRTLVAGVQKRFMALSLAVGMSVLGAGAMGFVLSGCAPPPTGQHESLPHGNLAKDGGREIIEVDAVRKPPFKTVLVDGVDMLQARGDVGQFGGAFYETQIGDGPKTFNAWQSSDATSTTMAGMMSAGLVTTDAYTGEVVPYLAKDVKLLDDQRTYRVTLRKGLTWSDGKPLTSKDVVFTWNEIVKNGLGNASQRDVNTINGQFPTVRALDELTVEFVTAEPFAPFMRNLALEIAPEHIFKPIISKAGPKGANNAFSNAWGTTDAATNPNKFISSGMWLLDSYDPVQKRVVFKRNPHFFMVDKKNQRLPYLDKYVVSFVGDMNNQQLQFEQGKTDIYSIPGDKLALTRKLGKPDFKIYNMGPSSGTTFVSFNLNTRKRNGKSIVDPVKSAWFTSQAFRQAVDYAINREDIVSNIIKGVGAPLFTAESLSSIYLNKKIADGHPQDLEKAKLLLRDAGFKWDAKGQLLDNKGRPVEFTLYTNTGNTIREAIGVQIKDDLAQLGMKVNFKPIDFNVLVGKMDSSDWEAIVMGLTGGTLEPNMGANVWKSDGFLHMFNQREIPKDGSPVNISDRFPWEADLDKIFADGVRVFDFDKRKAIYDRYQQIAYEQAPFIYLYSPLNMVAVKSRIQNFDPTPLATMHNLEEIWIKE